MPDQKQIPDFLILLAEANQKRNAIWDPENKLTPLFFALEHAGEVGELCNVIKKIQREKLGLPGSRVTRQHLIEELGDVLITLSLLCNSLQVTPQELIGFTADKFNVTSAKLNLPIYLGLDKVRDKRND